MSLRNPAIAPHLIPHQLNHLSQTTEPTLQTLAFLHPSQSLDSPFLESCRLSFTPRAL